MNWNADIESFVEDGLSVIEVIGLIDLNSGNELSYVGSYGNTVVQLDMLNPRTLDAVYTITPVDDSLFDGYVSLDDSNALDNRLYLTVDPALGAEHQDLELTLDIYASSINRSYRESLVIPCNSVPGAVENVEVKADGSSIPYLAFTLPSGDTDDDLNLISISWYDSGDASDTGSKTFLTGDSTYTSSSYTSFSNYDSTAGVDGLCRYFSPGHAASVGAYNFTIQVIDSIGLNSSSVIASNDAGCITLNFDLSGTGGNSLSFDSSDLFTNTGGTVSFSPGSGDLVSSGSHWGWYVDGTEQAGETSSSYSYLADSTGVFTIGCSVEYNGILYSGSTTLTVVDQPTVSYSANGGSGFLPASASYGIGDPVTVAAVSTLTRTGYTQTAVWNTTPDGSGSSYAGGGSFNIGSGSVILYAQWTEAVSGDTHSLNYEANGGAGSMGFGTVEEEATASLATCSFTRTNHSFAGWALTPGGAVEFHDGGSLTMGREDVTLYAVWQYDYDLVDLSGFDSTVSMETAVVKPLVASYLPDKHGDAYKAGYIHCRRFSSLHGPLLHRSL